MKIDIYFPYQLLSTLATISRLVIRTRLLDLLRFFLSNKAVGVGHTLCMDLKDLGCHG